MRKLKLISVCIFLLLSCAEVSAQPVTKVKSHKRTHIYGIWYGNVQLIDSVSLSSLLTEDELKAEGRPISAVDTVQSFLFLSVKLTLLTPEKGPIQLTVTENFTVNFREIISKATAGCYVMITDIKTQTPNRIVYLENCIFKLVQ